MPDVLDEDFNIIFVLLGPLLLFTVCVYVCMPEFCEQNVRCLVRPRSSIIFEEFFSSLTANVVH